LHMAFEMNNLTRNLPGLVGRDRIKQMIFDRQLEISNRWHQNLTEGQDMDSMTPRERFKAVTQFRKPDRLRLYERASVLREAARKAPGKNAWGRLLRVVGGAQ